MERIALITKPNLLCLLSHETNQASVAYRVRQTACKICKTCRPELEGTPGQDSGIDVSVYHPDHLSYQLEILEECPTAIINLLKDDTYL
jgi:hypothetical protein